MQNLVARLTEDLQKWGYLMFVSLIVWFCSIYFWLKAQIQTVVQNQEVMVQNQTDIKSDLGAYKINQFNANKDFMWYIATYWVRIAVLETKLWVSIKSYYKKSRYSHQRDQSTAIRLLYIVWIDMDKLIEVKNIEHIDSDIKKFTLEMYATEDIESQKKLKIKIDILIKSKELLDLLNIEWPVVKPS